jgi:hypothetical protein
LVDGDERTTWYLPVAPGADADATNMAVAIKFALRHLPEPEVAAESDTYLAAGIGALQGAISAHERRITNAHGDDGTA